MSVLLSSYNKIIDHFICFIKRLYFVLYYLVFVQCLIALRNNTNTCFGTSVTISTLVLIVMFVRCEADETY